MSDTSILIMPILIVDEDSVILKYYDKILRKSGFSNYILCEDSRVVSNILSEKLVGIILLDLSMPYISGKELLCKIKKEYPYIQVIIITGNDDIDNAVECLKCGAYDYLTKPFSLDKLLKTINNAFEVY